MAKVTAKKLGRPPKKVKFVLLTARISPRVRKGLLALASKKGESLSYYVRNLVRSHVDGKAS